jgi:NMD protein affecting ribosome stability and mRNA decay
MKETYEELKKKATPFGVYYDEVHVPMCPKCYVSFANYETDESYNFKYCPNCGQRLDWSKK